MSFMERNLTGRVPRLTAALALGAFALACAPLTTISEAQADARRTLGIPGVRGGVVTTSEPLAAKAGAEILRNGGNAIDAAAAVTAVLNVIEPQSSGIGGGGFMMIHLAKGKKTFIVDSRERAPAAATPDMFVGQGFGTRSTSGIAVGVPGTIKGIATALDRWGTISLAEALAPAIDVAENGFLVTSRLDGSLRNSTGGLTGRLSNEPGVAAYEVARGIFAPGGSPLSENDLLVQPELARTLKAIAEKGPDVFYHCGFDPANDIAQAIVDTQLATRTGNPAGVGRMTCDDLADYEIAVREPVEGKYRGFRIVSMPPPSSGGLTVIYILKLLEQFPIGDAEQGFGFGSTKTMHVMIEAMRLAFADRAVWMGDTDFVDLPVNGIISDAYLATREGLIDADGNRMPDTQAVASDPRPFDFAGEVPKVKLAAINLPDLEGLNTTHYTIIDRDGNIVTYTNTIESGWGTGLMVPGFGFLLNNELTDFNGTPAANPDPNNFNPGANDVAPFKRPRSSMSPTMIFKGRKPVAAFGSPGGSTIIGTVANIAINLIDHEMTVQEAVDAPRVVQTSATGFFATPRREIGFDLDEIQGLRDRGHNVRTPSVIGSAQTIVVGRDKKQYGAADKRRIGGIVSLTRDEIRDARDGDKDKDKDGDD